MDNKNLIISLDKLGEAFVIELKRQLVRADKRATGQLLNSIGYKLTNKSDDEIVIDIIADNYLRYVDQGIGPAAGHNRGKMMSYNTIKKALIPWMKARGIKPRNKKTGKFIKYSSAGYLIARKIQRDGVKATNVIIKTRDSIFNNKKDIVVQAAVKDFIDFLKKVIV